MGERKRLPATSGIHTVHVQWYLADKKTHLPRTLPQAFAWGPMVVLGVEHFLVGEVTL